jgi:hypothetical protein
MTTWKSACLLILMTAAAGPAVAQEPPAVFTFAVPHQAQGGVFVGGNVAGMGVVAVEPFEGGKPVTGAPYSAVAVTEVTQTLADGNRIEHRSSVAVHRDSAGRVRREQPSIPLGGLIAQPGEPIVTITDPASGTHVMLNRERRAAFRSKAPEAGVFFERPVAVARADIARADAGKGDAAQRARTERLGDQQIEGVRAEGTRTTMTIPAGAIGNQLPIEVVSERWYSPELQVVVMTRRSDPRFGETVYRLTEIVRAEPPAELFQVPADFTVR